MADLVALDGFNGTIKKLVRFAVTKSKRLDWGGATKRVKILLDDAPMAVISVLGPALGKHKDRIMANDEKFFLETDLTSEIPAEFGADKKEIASVMGIIKSVYSSCTDAEKREILADMQNLVTAFESYRRLTT